MLRKISKNLVQMAAVVAFVAAGCGGDGRDGTVYDTRHFQATVPAGASGQSVVHTFEPEVDLPYDPGDYDLGLLGITITSSADLSFATLIEVEMKEFSIFGNAGGYDTVARFEGVLAPGTRSVNLGLRQTSLDSYVETFGDNLHLKVRIAGTAPPQPVSLSGSIGLRIEFEDGEDE